MLGRVSLLSGLGGRLGTLITTLLGEFDLLDLLSQLIDLLDEFDVLAHDPDVVLLVYLVVLGEILLQHAHGLLEVLALAQVLRVDVMINLDWFDIYVGVVV